jgi:hypothetical protein
VRERRIIERLVPELVEPRRAKAEVAELDREVFGVASPVLMLDLSRGAFDANGIDFSLNGQELALFRERDAT